MKMNTNPNKIYINLFNGREMDEVEYCICKNNNNGQCKKKLQISLVVSLNLLDCHFCLAFSHCQPPLQTTNILKIYKTLYTNQ
jgi:hypothetical protein